MAKIERTQNATRNIIFGVILKIYQIKIIMLFKRKIKIKFYKNDNIISQGPLTVYSLF